jgi:hypothetical protein
MTPSTPDVIHRYEIPIDGLTHRFTIGRGPLHFACRQGDRVEFWAYAPTSSSATVREFTVTGTGHPLPPGTWHVGTVLAPSGNLVWHVLEVVQPVDVVATPGGDATEIGAQIGRAVRRARRRDT